MCRSIIRLREGAAVLDAEAMEAAARQYVRKVAGFREPAAHNREVFERAVAEITRATEQLMYGLEIRGGRGG